MKKIAVSIAVLVFILSGCSDSQTFINEVESSTISDMYSIVDFSEYVEIPTVTKNISDSFKNDFDIITKEGHPKFWDKVELSREFWGNLEKGKVRFADSYEKYQNSHIITMESYSNDVIENIEVYFENSTDSILLDIDKALHIVKSYLPIEVLDAYYEKDKSFIAIPENDKEKKTSYFVSYNLIDKSQKETLNLFYNVIVEIQVKNNVVKMFRIYDGYLPNWVYNLEFNGYSEKLWDYSFN